MSPQVDDACEDAIKIFLLFLVWRITHRGFRLIGAQPQRCLSIALVRSPPSRLHLRQRVAVWILTAHRGTPTHRQIRQELRCVRAAGRAC